VPNVHTHELVLDAQGNLFGEHLWYEGERTDKWGHYVWKRDAAGRVTTIKPRTEGFLTNYSFQRDAAGNMYWAQYEKGEIRKRSPNGAITRVVGELKAMRWLHVTPAGTLYVVDSSDLVRVRDGRAVLSRATTIARRTRSWAWTDRAENVSRRQRESCSEARNAERQVSIVAKSTFVVADRWGVAANGDLWCWRAR
jgi:hypothetical protein